MTRNERDRICFIANPRSAGGKTASRLEALREVAARHFTRVEIRTTHRPGHASELAAAASAEFDVVAAFGGDGTASEVVNGLFDGERPRNPRCVFALVPGGTGSDLMKSLRIPRDLEGAVAVAATGADRATDVLRVEAHDARGAPVGWTGINVAGFGANGEVVAYANQGSKRLGGTVTFLRATVRTLLEYRSPAMAVRWVDEQGTEGVFEGRVLVGFVANGHYCGGGMCVGRGGSMSDGLMEFTLIPRLPAVRILRNAHRIYTGTLDGVPDVLRIRAREVEARALDGVTVRMDIDGEQPGVCPVRVRVISQGLLVRACW